MTDPGRLLYDGQPALPGGLLLLPAGVHSFRLAVVATRGSHQLIPEEQLVAAWQSQGCLAQLLSPQRLRVWAPALVRAVGVGRREQERHQRRHNHRYLAEHRDLLIDRDVESQQSII